MVSMGGQVARRLGPRGCARLSAAGQGAGPSRSVTRACSFLFPSRRVAAYLLVCGAFQSVLVLSFLWLFLYTSLLGFQGVASTGIMRIRGTRCSAGCLVLQQKVR